MVDLVLFQAALGLVEPWKVAEVRFDAERRRLDLRIDFPKGARFACPECGVGGCKVHDSEQKTWRHLNFFEHEAFLTARVPRVICAEHGVRQVVVPWARERSDFTLLFEALVMALVKEMPVNALAGLVGEHDTKIWRVVHHYVDAAVDAQDLSGMTRLGLDDTSFRRGQDYVTVFADLEPGERRAVFVVEGRDQATVEQFKGFLVEHSGDPSAISEVCQDMSAAYLAAVREHLPEAQVTFDRYHVKQKLSEAIDAIRRAESKTHRELLRGTRYLWLNAPRISPSSSWTGSMTCSRSRWRRSRRTSLRCALMTSTTSRTPTRPRSTCAAGSPTLTPAASNRSSRSARCSRVTGMA